MAQLYSVDARVGANNVALPDGVEVDAVSTVAIPVPYENAKAKVLACGIVTPGALADGFEAELVRNPDSDDLSIAEWNMPFTAGGDSFYFAIAGVDPIPDGRDVVYALRLTSSTDASVLLFNYIEVSLLSG